MVLGFLITVGSAFLSATLVFGWPLSELNYQWTWGVGFQWGLLGAGLLAFTTAHAPVTKRWSVIFAASLIWAVVSTSVAYVYIAALSGC